jgi:hypothetical protein
MSGDRFTGSFKTFKPFNRYAPFKPPPRITSGAGSLVLPRDAGEDEGGGFNDLNFLNDLNQRI